MLGLALIFAIAAVFLAQDWLKKQSANVVTKNTTTVVVARTALGFGAIVRGEQLRVIEWPSANIPKGAFRKIEKLVHKGEPRVVLSRIEANEPILSSKVSGFGGRASLSTVIADGMRASTIRVNDVNGVAGFVLPGDRVDILLTRDEQGQKRRSRGGNLFTDVLLQNVKVLAIDQQSDEKKDKPSVAKAVTLEVSSIQSQKLVLAQTVGSLSLALRNVKNGKSIAAKTIRVRDLRVGEANDITPAPAKKSIRKFVKTKTIVRRDPNSLVKVTRGLKSSEYKVLRERTKSLYPVRLMRQWPEATKKSEPKSDQQKSSSSAPPIPGSGQQSGISSTGPLSLYRGEISDGFARNASADGNVNDASVTR